VENRGPGGQALPQKSQQTLPVCRLKKSVHQGCHPGAQPANPGLAGLPVSTGNWQVHPLTPSDVNMRVGLGAP
jgi:hypothetical protein